MSSAYKWASIVDPNDHATVVTDLNLRAKRQRAMRSCHGRAVHMLAVCGSAPAEAIESAIDARYFSISAARGETC